MAIAGDIVIELKLDDKDMSVKLKDAGVLLRQFNSSLDRTARSVQNLERNSESLGTKFRQLVMTLGNLRFVAMDINDIFLRLPSSILATAGELERLEVLMRGLSKELTSAGRAAEGLRDFNFVTNLAKNAPFEIGALSDAFVKLKTAGIDPTNGSLQALVDSVAKFGGNSEQLKRASVAIQQMAGKGVISMEELRQQLGEAVPDAMKAMADGMGVTMSELAKIVSTGTLGADAALKKMLLQMKINNEGSAAEMMKTWSGMTAQLKTEWDLMAKFIADNEFGNAAKDAVMQLTNALRSDEFRQFAQSFGQGLGEAIRAIGEVVRFVIKYREEIVTLAQAWLAYKVVFSGIVPIAKNLENAFTAGKNALREKTAEIVRNTTATQNMAVREASAAMYSAEREAAALERKLALHQKELASVRARNAAIIAEDARAAAALEGINRRAYIPGLNNSTERDQQIRKLGELAAKNSELTARERELALAVQTTSERLGQARATAAAKQAAFSSLTGTMTLHRAATVAATAATNALSFAMNMLGGPIGIAITAIMGLVYWYERAARAAEESAERQARANAEISSAQDLLDAQKEVREKEAKLKALEESAAKRYDPLTGAMLGEDALFRESDAYKEALDQVLKARAELENIRKSRNAVMAREAAQAEILNADRRVRAIQEATQTEIAAINAKQQAELNGVAQNTEQWKKINNRYVEERTKVSIEGLKKRIDVEKDAIRAAEGDLLKTQDEVRRQAISAFIRDREGKRDQLENELRAAEEALQAKVAYKQKADKALNEDGKRYNIDKIAVAIGNVEEERARIETEIASIVNLYSKVDRASALISEIFAKWENGDFKYGKNREKDATLEQVTELALKISEAEKLKVYATELQKTSQFILGVMPEYESAIERLNNPLEVNKKGERETSLDRFISKLNSGDLQRVLKTLGTSLDEVRSKAMTIDLADFFSKMEQDTKRINDSIVADSREAALARTRAENEEYRRFAQNYIDRLIAVEGYTDRVDRLHKMLADNINARNEDMARRFALPIDQALARWKNMERNMNERAVQWAEGFTDVMTDTLLTGQGNIDRFMESMLRDIARTTLQAALGDGLRAVFQNIAAGLGGTSASEGLMASTVTLTSAQTTQATAVSANTVAIQAASTSLNSMIISAQQAAGVLASLAGSSAGSSIGTGLFAEMFSLGGSTTGYGTNWGSTQTAMLMEQDSWFFAKGGIMTSMGSMPLKKYAAGGVANSPQFAVFGEGDMPEAYVPLPDGRTIPVTLSGVTGQAQAPNVSISIVVNKDGTENRSGNDSGVWSGMANRIKMVVQEEIANQKRPGGMLAR